MSSAKPTRRRRDPEPAPAPAEPPAPDYAQKLLASLALFCASTAIPFSQVPILSTLTKPLAALGCVLGAVAFFRARRREPLPRQVWPALAAIFCLGVLLLAGSWSDLGMANTKSSSTAAAKPVVISTVGQGMTPPKSVDADTWVDAKTGMVEQNQVRIRVVSAKVDAVPFKTPPADPSARKKYLLIRLRLLSVNFTQPVNYETWADPLQSPGKHEPRLADDLDRTYRRVTFGDRADVAGVWRNNILTVSRPVEELLVFELQPLEPVQFLRLELPASAIGGSGSYRLKLPRYMITTKEDR